MLQAESKVQAVQDLLDAGLSETPHQDLAEAKATLHSWLQIKETHWHQKSKIKWLNEGDRKTTFFHASAKSRGSVNRIDRILF